MASHSVLIIPCMVPFFPLPSFRTTSLRSKIGTLHQRTFQPLTVSRSPFLCARTSSEFNVKVTGCSRAVVLGDNAYLSIGSPATDSKCGRDASHHNWSAWYFSQGIQSMEINDWKTNQSININRLVLVNRWSIDNHAKIIHRLASIGTGLRNIRWPTGNTAITKTKHCKKNPYKHK